MSTGRKEKPVKVTVDTNILISRYLYPGGTILKLFDIALSGSIVMCVSDDILREFTNVVVRKFGKDPEYAVTMAGLVRTFCEVSTGAGHKVDVARDETDNRIIECALASSSGYIISGDKHLLEIGSYKGIKILKASDFIRWLPDL